MIQIRNVPESLRRELETCAAKRGLTLSDDLLGESRRMVERSKLDALRARLARREPVHTSVSAVDAVRAERDAR